VAGNPVAVASDARHIATGMLIEIQIS